MNIKRKNIPEVEIEDANKIFDCYQQSAKMKSVNAMNDLDRHYRDESGVKDDYILDGDCNVIDDVMNIYFNDNENHKGSKRKML
ncbi:hypothetical protein F8M41_025474 [Gigaspora margarita]|uniref:Uncharacterized protein n=1 Tax=Gigaspora margarita TaxID=4874 RepID=A0A8H3XK50_GIGMA|nr:hypothetical protein F8M41_025474 [Gigaspora margarita]